MKIFTVTDNCEAPAAEAVGLLSCEGNSEIGWYEMSDSSVLRSGNPFFIPDFDTEFVILPTVTYRIGRLGKSIQAKFADRYVDGKTVSCAVIAVNRLRELRRRGEPWERAVSFDRSCMVGNLRPIVTLDNNEVFRVRLGENETTFREDGLRLRVEEVIEKLSSENTLKTGDLILCGIGHTVLHASIGETLEIKSETENLTYIDINIR